MQPALFELRDVLRARTMAPLAQIAAELKLSPAVTQAMLEHWMRRGMVSRLPAAPGCGSAGASSCASCGQCGRGGAGADLYAWNQPAATRPMMLLHQVA